MQIKRIIKVLLSTIPMLLLLAAMPLHAAPFFGNKLIVIKIGPSDIACQAGDRDACNDFLSDIVELRQRVRQLEQAVVQIQGSVFDARKTVGLTADSESPGFACTMSLSNRAPLIARGSSKIVATAKVNKLCEEAGESFCANNGIQCEQESRSMKACMLTSDWHGTFVASGYSKLEAVAKVRQQCESSSERFCDSLAVKCDD